jgi:hypothetical protein
MNMDSQHIILIIIIVVLLIYMYSVIGFEKYNNINSDKEIIKLWVSHLLYTRLTMMAYFSNDSQLKFLSDRLIENQREIGQKIGKLYGFDAGQIVTNELIKHINIAIALLKALKNKNKKLIDQETNNFYQNADDIGIYLDKLFHTKIFRHHMYVHIQTLIENVKAYANNQYNYDIVTLDQYINSGIDMAFSMIKTH